MEKLILVLAALLVSVCYSQASLCSCSGHTFSRPSNCSSCKVCRTINAGSVPNPYQEVSVHTYGYCSVVAQAVEQQISMEQAAMYQYQYMWAYFEHSLNRYPGIAKFFKEQSEEEKKHAEMLISYQLKRGSLPEFVDIKEPTRKIFSSMRSALCHALEMEKKVTQSLYCLKEVASGNCIRKEYGCECVDHDLNSFIEHEMIPEQFASMKFLGDLICQLEKLDDNGDSKTGEYLFDKMTLQK